MTGLQPLVVWASLIPAGMLLLAITGRWPYGFFILLRWVVSGCALYVATAAHHQKSSGWMWIMVGIAVLFNPLIPIHLRRDTWQVIDFVAAAVFVGAGVALRRK